jgi:hypothetical protein
VLGPRAARVREWGAAWVVEAGESHM